RKLGSTVPFARSYNDGSYARFVAPADGFDASLDPPRRRAHLNNEDLVFRFIDCGAELLPQPDEFYIVELTEEDTVLRVVTEAVQRLEHRIAAAVVGDIIGHDIMFSTHGHRVVMPTYSGMSPRIQRARSRAWIRTSVRQEQR